MADLKALIAKAKAETAERGLEIVVGGEIVEVLFSRVPGHVWADLLVTHPPRKGSDENVGVNPDAIVRDYPVEYITVEGEPVDTETWRDLYEAVTSPNIKFMAAAIWMLNQSEPIKMIADLGKARAGAQSKKRRSPAN